jgi:hypothetical protein
MTWRKGYTTKAGKRVRGRWVKTRGRARKTARRNPRNPYTYYGGKRGKRISRGSYTRHKPRTRRVAAKTYYQKKKWYPHRQRTASGKWGKWLSLRQSFKAGLLNKREFGMVKRRHPTWIAPGATFAEYKALPAVRKAPAQLSLPFFGKKAEPTLRSPTIKEYEELGLFKNPAEAIAMLPTERQYGYLARAAGLGFVGFAGSIAGGRVAAGMPKVQEYLGAWSSVAGNVFTGLSFWAAASLIKNEKLDAMVPYVATGAGVAALVNTAINLIARRTIPASIASWFVPGAGSVAAAPGEAVVPSNDLGQVDVYEAALDGVGGIEDDLEMELSRMGLGDTRDGIFNDDVFGEYLQTPLGAEVEEAAAGFGAEVEEAAAGTGEYLEVPMGSAGEYLEVPLGAEVEEAAAGFGAEVEEAAAGTGEYLEVPMGSTGEYLEVPLGAEVEEAAAGLGQSNVSALMPGFRGAVQDIVRKRIASGLPLDQAFYEKLGRASGRLATKKFQRQFSGQSSPLAVAPRKAPLLRKSAPTYKRPVLDPRMTPGSAEQIPTSGEKEFSGIFEGKTDEGIF